MAFGRRGVWSDLRPCIRVYYNLLGFIIDHKEQPPPFLKLMGRGLKSAYSVELRDNAEELSKIKILYY